MTSSLRTSWRHAAVRDRFTESGLAPVSYLPGARPGSSASRTPSAGRRLGASAAGEATVSPLSRGNSDGAGADDVRRAESDGHDWAAAPGFTEDNAPEVVDHAVVEQRVLRALARKSLSETEVRALIADNGLEGEAAEAIVARLIELRYVDDRMLAEELCRGLSENKGQSKAAVARGLAARGLPSDVVAEAIASIEEDDERDAARSLAEKRARQLGSLDAQTMERRLSGFLARRGYPGGLVREIVPDIVRARSVPSGGPRFR